MKQLSFFFAVSFFPALVQAAQVYVCGADQNLVVAIDRDTVIYAQTSAEIFPNGMSPDFMTTAGEASYTFFVDEYDQSLFFYRIFVRNDQIVRTQVLVQEIQHDDFQPLPVPGATFPCLRL